LNSWKPKAPVTAKEVPNNKGVSLIMVAPHRLNCFVMLLLPGFGQSPGP
jgi:hypothetical protein